MQNYDQQDYLDTSAEKELHSLLLKNKDSHDIREWVEQFIALGFLNNKLDNFHILAKCGYNLTSIKLRDKPLPHLLIDMEIYNQQTGDKNYQNFNFAASLAKLKQLSTLPGGTDLSRHDLFVYAWKQGAIDIAHEILKQNCIPSNQLLQATATMYLNPQYPHFLQDKLTSLKSDKPALQSFLALFMKLAFATNKLDNLDVLSKNGYNPITINNNDTPVLFSLLQHQIQKEKASPGFESFNFGDCIKKLKTFETRDIKIVNISANLEGDKISLVRKALFHGLTKAVDTLFECDAISEADKAAYRIYFKNNTFKSFNQHTDLIDTKLQNNNITKVSHLFKDGKDGVCSGLSYEFLRYHARHVSDIDHHEANEVFFNKLQNLDLDSNRAKRILIYHATHGRMISYDDHDTNIGKEEFAKFQATISDLNNKSFKAVVQLEDAFHAIAIFRNGETFSIFEPNIGIVESKDIKEIFDLLSSYGDRFEIYASDQEMFDHHFVSADNAYDKDSKNFFKLLEALYTNDTPEIARLSKIQNIFYHGYSHLEKDDKKDDAEEEKQADNTKQDLELTDVDISQAEDNPLYFAIQTKEITEESLYTLILSNPEFEIANSSELADIFTNLLQYNKASERVLGIIAEHSKTDELKHYVLMAKSALSSGTLKPNTGEDKDTLILDIQYSPKSKEALGVVAFMESELFSKSNIVKEYYTTSKEVMDNGYIHLVIKEKELVDENPEAAPSHFD